MQTRDLKETLTIKEGFVVSVPVYQIENILTLYCRKLELAWRDNRSPESAKAASSRQNTAIAQSKKEAVINNVTESIISKITRMGPHQFMEEQKRSSTMASPRQPRESTPSLRKSILENESFTFTYLDKHNRHHKRTITLGTQTQSPLASGTGRGYTGD